MAKKTVADEFDELLDECAKKIKRTSVSCPSCGEMVETCTFCGDRLGEKYWCYRGEMQTWHYCDTFCLTQAIPVQLISNGRVMPR